MASLANQTISSSYDGLIKTATDNAVGVSGVQLLEDGSGNSLALSVGRANNGVTITGNLAVDTNTLYVDAANNRVGIGVSNPADYAFTNLVVGNTSSDGGVTIVSGTSSVSRLLFADGSAAPNEYIGGVQYFHSDNSMRLYTNDDERMRIDSSGNVGINQSDPSAYSSVSANNLVIGNASGNKGLTISSSTTGFGNIAFADGTGATDQYRGLIQYGHTDNAMGFWTNASEAMRIDSSGRVIVGGGTAYSADSATITGDGFVGLRRTSATPLELRRDTTDGNLIAFQKDGTDIAQIGVASSGLTISTGGSERMRIESDGDILLADVSLRSVTLSDVARAVGSNATGGQIRFQPQTDDAVNLGSLSNRWDNVYAANGTIQTSDANEKQQIESLDDVELRVATRIKGLVRKFKWNSAVNKKGDDARIHIGVIAQDVKEAFELEGLDPNKYALFCSDTWWEKEVIEIDSEGVETTKTEVLEEYEEGANERTRLGVRYTELLAFVISAL